MKKPTPILKRVHQKVFQVKTDKNGRLYRSKMLDLPKKNYLMIYGDNGKLNEISHYNTKGALHSKRIFYYDIKGNRIEDRLFNSTLLLIGLRKFEFNTQNRCVKMSSYNGENHLLLRVLNYYNEKGQMVKSETYKSKGKTVETSTYIFDNNENFIREIKEDGQGQLKSIASFQYNQKHQLISRKIYDKQKELKQTESYLLNEKGIRLSTECRDAKGNLLLKTVYDTSGDIIKKIRFLHRGKSLSIWDYQYNAHRDIISLRKWRDHKVIRCNEFHYDYDTHENWVKKIVFQSGISQKIYIRTLKYS